MAVQITKSKKQLIDKANTSVVIAVAVAGFFVVFSLFAARALWSQRTYQAKVISKKEKAVQQLEENQKTVEKLAANYKVFISKPDNVIGGNPAGVGEKDGNNAKIVLDALPSKYDFPAFVTGVEKMLRARKFVLKSIGGNDEEVNQTPEKVAGKNKGKIVPIEVPFKFATTTNGYANTKDLLTTLELSIRPIKVNSLTISANSPTEIAVNVEAVSYYQPAKGITITSEVVK